MPWACSPSVRAGPRRKCSETFIGSKPCSKKALAEIDIGNGRAAGRHGLRLRR